MTTKLKETTKIFISISGMVILVYWDSADCISSRISLRAKDFHHFSVSG